LLSSDPGLLKEAKTMPPPNLGVIQGNPPDLLLWLQNNLLLAGLVTDVPNPPGTAWVTIGAPGAPAPAPAFDLAGTAMGVYALRCNGAGLHDALPSYVCNYQAGQVRSVLVAGARDFCFTITLNGCTFGIGPLAPGGARLVSHANTGGNTLPQRTQTWAAHAVPANALAITMLEPALYRRMGGNLQATVFGIRSAGNWRFYFQLYNRPAGGANITVYGVFPIITP
jgi:hypothetical protein